MSGKATADPASPPRRRPAPRRGLGPTDARFPTQTPPGRSRSLFHLSCGCACAGCGATWALLPAFPSAGLSKLRSRPPSPYDGEERAPLHVQPAAGGSPGHRIAGVAALGPLLGKRQGALGTRARTSCAVTAAATEGMATGTKGRQGLGAAAQGGPGFLHAAGNSTQQTTYGLFTSGIFHVTFSVRNCCE